MQGGLSNPESLAYSESISKTFTFSNSEPYSEAITQSYGEAFAKALAYSCSEGDTQADAEAFPNSVRPAQDDQLQEVQLEEGALRSPQLL